MRVTHTTGFPVGVAPGLLHGFGESLYVVPENEVIGTGADERQGSEGAELGQPVTAGDEVPGLPSKGRAEGAGGRDALRNEDLVASVTKLTLDECRIIFVVFDEEHVEGSHQYRSFRRCRRPTCRSSSGHTELPARYSEGFSPCVTDDDKLTSLLDDMRDE